MKCLKCEKIHDGSFGSGKYCSRKCSNSRTWTGEHKMKLKISLQNSEKACNALKKQKEESWNKKIIKKCPICNKEFRVFNCENKRIYCSNSCYKKDKNALFRKKSPGGYRQGSGIGKSGWYKGYWCDSSWELAWIIFHLENNIHFIRNKEKFSYVFNRKKYNYIPDFIVNSEYIEIKGFSDKKTKEKINQFPHKLKILKKKEIKPFLEYVVQKHGKDFVSLYESGTKNKKLNKCLVCCSPAKNKLCSRRCSGIFVKKQKNY